MRTGVCVRVCVCVCVCVRVVIQGNPPLSLPTLELRTKNWARGNSLLFYIFADDVNIFKRSDAAIYHVSARPDFS